MFVIASSEESISCSTGLFRHMDCVAHPNLGHLHAVQTHPRAAHSCPASQFRTRVMHVPILTFSWKPSVGYRAFLDQTRITARQRHEPARLSAIALLVHAPAGSRTELVIMSCVLQRFPCQGALCIDRAGTNEVRPHCSGSSEARAPLWRAGPHGAARGCGEPAVRTAGSSIG